jgi:hypothetical protein
MNATEILEIIKSHATSYMGGMYAVDSSSFEDLANELADEPLNCEMCSSEMELDDYEFSDICPQCLEG